jgi:hypothetical protein
VGAVGVEQRRAAQPALVHLVGLGGRLRREQNIYIAGMSNPTTPTGGRFVISQPA